MRAFVVLGLVFSTPSQETGSGKRLRDDLFCVERDANPQLSQSTLAHINISQLMTSSICSQPNLTPAYLTRRRLRLMRNRSQLERNLTTCMLFQCLRLGAPGAAGTMFSVCPSICVCVAACVLLMGDGGVSITRA